MRGRVRLLRGDRPRLGRPGDPADRVEPAGARRQGPARRRRLHRALELPAAAADLEGRAGARRRQHDRRQAVGDHAAGDARPWPALRPPAGRRLQRDRRRRRDRGGADRRRARRLHRLHRLRCDRDPRRRRLRRAHGPRQPRDGRQGPLHRLLRHRLGGADRDRRPRRRLGRLPQRGPGLHLGRALLRQRAHLRRLRQRLHRAHEDARARRPDGGLDRPRPDGLGAAARQGRRPGRCGAGRRRRAADRRRRRRPSAATSTRRR